MTAAAPDRREHSSRTPGSGKEALDWRRCWYPVSFVEDLPEGEPYGFTIHDRRFVLFRDENGGFHCLADRCPHRAARLSNGRLTDNGLECLYHGWLFGPGGRCLSIPQLDEGLSPPARADVPSFPALERQGVVWVWPTVGGSADEAALPLLPELDLEAVTSIDYMIDLPYDQSYLIENVIDIAHIHVAHADVRGGGHREMAKPLEFEVTHESLTGIRATFRSRGLESAGPGRDLRSALVEFVAPNLVAYRSGYRNRALVSGLALYSLPSGRQRCRLIYRAYSNFWRLRDRLRPRWLEHRHQTLVLEQDMQVVIGQHEEIEHSNKSLRELWLPIKTSDVLVLKYRQWLDRYGGRLPTFRGYTGARSADDQVRAPTPPTGRYEQHTRICAACRNACRRSERLGRLLLWIAAAFAGVAILSSSAEETAVWLGLAVSCLAGRYGARRILRLFRSADDLALHGT